MNLHSLLIPLLREFIAIMEGINRIEHLHNLDWRDSGRYHRLDIGTAEELAWLWNAQRDWSANWTADPIKVGPHDYLCRA